jgi:hypothetical protein
VHRRNADGQDYGAELYEHCQPRDSGSAEKLGVITLYRTNGSRPEATFENHALPRNAHLARTSTDGHSTHCGCESRAEH